jgi:hypothetical protein
MSTEETHTTVKLPISTDAILQHPLSEIQRIATGLFFETVVKAAQNWPDNRPTEQLFDDIQERLRCFRVAFQMPKEKGVRILDGIERATAARDFRLLR